MAKNKFLAAKKDFDSRIVCKCQSINAFNKGENKGSELKRVGDNCNCVVGKDFGSQVKVKAFRVFVQEN